MNLFKYPQVDFPILGVTNRGGVYLNGYVKGSDIHQAYKKVRGNELVYNPYRVNVGSIGVVPKEYNNYYISPAYVIFGTKRGLLNEYIDLVLSSDWFNPYLRAATSGSVRQNLTFDLLSELKVPIPPLNVQRQIVNHWNKAKQRAEGLTEKARSIEEDVDNLILHELGVEKRSYTKSYSSFAIQFQDLERWGVSFNDYSRQGLLRFKSNYDVVSFGSVVSKYQYGTSDKANNNNNGYTILRMNNIVDGEIDISDLKYINLDSKNFNSLRLDKGDLLFNRTNSKELVGKTAVFDLNGDYVFASYLVRVKLNLNKIDPYYTNYIFNSLIIRNQINAISRQIIGQANINTEELGDFKIPLPPLKKQLSMVKKINKKRLQIKSLRNRAQGLINEAKRKIQEGVK